MQQVPNRNRKAIPSVGSLAELSKLPICLNNLVCPLSEYMAMWPLWNFLLLFISAVKSIAMKRRE